jgi:hypothetical protein
VGEKSVPNPSGGPGPCDAHKETSTRIRLRRRTQPRLSDSKLSHPCPVASAPPRCSLHVIVPCAHGLAHVQLACSLACWAAVKCGQSLSRQGVDGTSCAAALCHALRRLEHLLCGAPVGGPHLVVAALPRRVSWLSMSLRELSCVICALRAINLQGCQVPAPSYTSEFRLVDLAVAIQRLRVGVGVGRALRDFSQESFESWTKLARSRGTP